MIAYSIQRKNALRAYKHFCSLNDIQLPVDWKTKALAAPKPRVRYKLRRRVHPFKICVWVWQ
jgi:hypothetical protein